MRKTKFIIASVLISLIWFALLVICEFIFIVVLRKLSPDLLLYRDGFLENIIVYIFIILPFVIALFVSNYCFLKTKKNYVYFVSGCFVIVSTLYLLIFLLADSLLFGAASASGKDIAIFISPLIIIVSLILFLVNYLIIRNNDLHVKPLLLKVAGVMVVLYSIRFVYFMFNTLVIFSATSTGWSTLCVLSSGVFPPPIQGNGNSNKYPDTCLLEMGKSNIDVCSEIDYEANRNSCYLELSLSTNDKSICEKIGTNPPVYYINCIFRDNIQRKHLTNRCLHSIYRIEDYGKDIPIKDCINNKFSETKADF
ncbi:MAG: hypothetical protein D3910_01665 [Candidatus Electrothrix sp. ATG2]|nr:hypothetical protein [Candidatus Electrothrix sp. ATG2]